MGHKSLHSAAPQAIGYLHQARYALLRILDVNLSDDTSVVIEGLDDVSLRRGENGTLELDQLKHHVSRKAKLTDKSPDLWKTIRVWCSVFQNGGGVGRPIALNLVTTAEAPEESAASLLREGSGRDVEEAERLLLAAAHSSENDALKNAFDAFQALEEAERLALLRSVVVYDRAVTIEDAADQIKRVLLYSVERKHVESAYHRLEGWWFDKVVRQLLDPNSSPIPRGAVLAELRSIADQFSAENLPIDFADVYLSAGERAEYDERRFVQQLKDIAANTTRVKHAILDYYRAFEQRSRWVGEELVYDEDLQRYERKLINEWERRKAAYEDELTDESGEEEMQAFGRKLLRWVELEADLPIRPEVTEKYVVRGSYHMMADEGPPRVYWHPEFLERLEGVITESASEN